MRAFAATAVALLCSMLAAMPAAGASEWRLEQPQPTGSPFAAPLNEPGDLEFLSPSRGLLTVNSGSADPRIGDPVYSWDGRSWYQLATVCGNSGAVGIPTGAIVVAGPREFWTITKPSPSNDRSGDGIALCHFKDGQVIGSYSTPQNAIDPYRVMYAGACLAPNDCWFGGSGAEGDATGERRGAFHLHWDGGSLTTIYAPQGRGVSDAEVHNGVLYETVLAGPAPNNRAAPDLLVPEDQPRLIHRIEQGTFVNDDFLPAPLPGVPAGGSELLALDSDGTDMWAGGAGAASGPAAPPQGQVERPPLIARFVDGAWQEVTPTEGEFSGLDRIVDIAAVPGADHAWAAIETPGSTEYATVARIDPDGTVTKQQVPSTGAGRGSAAKIAFTSPVDGWLVTSRGWLFHFTDGTVQPQDSDPAFASLIAFRPNEAAAQFIPDAPPVDDSELFKPPPLEVAQPPAEATTRRLPRLLRGVKARVRGKKLYVRFQLTRRARVALIARRKGKIVARTRSKMMRRGRHTLVLRLDPKRWPQRLSFRTREPGQTNGGGGGDTGDTVATPGDVITTGNR